MDQQFLLHLRLHPHRLHLHLHLHHLLQHHPILCHQLLRYHHLIPCLHLQILQWILQWILLLQQVLLQLAILWLEFLLKKHNGRYVFISQAQCAPKSSKWLYILLQRKQLGKLILLNPLRMTLWRLLII